METLYQTEAADTRPERAMKQCPFCAERILYEAIKCRYCNEFLDRPAAPPASTSSGKWHRSTPALILALLTVGPLALPLVWTHPRYSRLVKTALTVGILGLAVGLCATVLHVSTMALDQIQSLGL